MSYKMLSWKGLYNRTGFSGYHLRIFFISFFTKITSISIALLLYYAISKIIAQELEWSENLAVITVIIFSILIVLPFLESFNIRLKNIFLSEYLSEDALYTRTAYKRFNLNSLIRSVFPDMVRLSGSTSGRMGVLTTLGTFEIYTYNKGRQRKVNTRTNYTINNELLAFLQLHVNGVSITETIKNQKINEDFNSLHSNFMIPFLFREKLFGFIAFSNIPTQDAIHNILILASQSAMTIHNKILTNKIAENLKYQKEIESANRIQNLLQTNKVPIFHKIHGEILSGGYSANLLLEFLPSQTNEWFFIILSLGGISKANRLILSYVLGILYSRASQNKITDFNYLKKLIQETISSIQEGNSDLIIGKINKEETIIIMQEGRKFKAEYLSKPGVNAISLGWKNEFHLTSDPLVIKMQSEPIIQFSSKQLVPK